MSPIPAIAPSDESTSPIPARARVIQAQPKTVVWALPK